MKKIAAILSCILILLIYSSACSPKTAEERSNTSVSYSELNIPELTDSNVVNAEVVWGDSGTLFVGILLNASTDNSVYQIWAYNDKEKKSERLFSLYENDINNEYFSLIKTKFLQLINNEFLCIKDTEGKRFYLFNIKSKQISTIDYPTDKTSNAILSPNGKYILYTADNILSDKDKEIHLYNIESKETTIICKNETMVGISNNSMYIITKFNMTPDIEESTHNGCHIWDLNGNLLFTYSSDSETVAGSTFSWSDENYLLFDTLSYDKEGNSITNVKLLDINSGQIKKFSSEYGSGIISPDARYSLLIGHTNQLLNLLTGDVASFELPGWAIRSKNINKEGDKAAITILTDGGEIKVYILTIIV